MTPFHRTKHRGISIQMVGSAQALWSFPFVIFRARFCRGHELHSNLKACATEAHRSTQQHTEAHSSTQKHTAAHRSTQQHTEAHSSTQQHTEAHSSTQQHTEAHSSTQKHTAAHRSTQKHTATHRSTQQHTATHRSTQQTHWLRSVGRLWVSAAQRASGMKNGVFWDVTPCDSCNNRRFGGT
jgi:uncharacterized Zn finger protein